MPVFSGIMKATIEMVENEACGTIFDTTYSMKSPSCHKKRKAKEPNEVSPLSAVASTPTVASIEALRKNQRSLNQRIANDSRDTNNKKETAGEDDDDENQSHDEENSQAPPNQLEFLDDVRNENNKLFKEVKYTREAVLDAENVDLIANKYVNQVDRLVQVSVYICLSHESYRPDSKFSSSSLRTHRFPGTTQCAWCKHCARATAMADRRLPPPRRPTLIGMHWVRTLLIQ
jgi:hypothetical protein